MVPFEVGAAEITSLVVGVILALAAPFLWRYVRTLGKVRGRVDSWHPQRSGYVDRLGASVAQVRRLQVTFKNGKDLPATVSEMRVEFYKEGEPLEDWARPNVAVVDEREQSSPLNIPPHESRQLTIIVTPGRDDIIRELQKADEAVFVARIEGGEDQRLQLTPPW
jgi:hypothetical protein